MNCCEAPSPYATATATAPCTGISCRSGCHNQGWANPMLLTGMSWAGKGGGGVLCCCCCCCYCVVIVPWDERLSCWIWVEVKMFGGQRERCRVAPSVGASGFHYGKEQALDVHPLISVCMMSSMMGTLACIMAALQSTPVWVEPHQIA